MSTKDKIILIICILVFGGLGVYLTFLASNINKFDSQVKAYKIEVNETSDIDGTMYYPVYYYRVDGQEYICEARSGSSSMLNKSKNIVYYDSINPQKCKTEYDQTSSRFAGIICLIVTALIAFFGFIKKPTLNNNNYEEVEQQFEEKTYQVMNVVSKVQLIIKRVILGMIIVVLFVFILFDTMLLKQTIKSKNYTQTIATYADKKEDSDECNYIFTDKKEKEHKVSITCSEGFDIKDKIKVKYNEKNPKDFYEETALLNRKGITWYVVKVLALILLIVLFFNKKLLSKISIGVSSD